MLLATAVLVAVSTATRGANDGPSWALVAGAFVLAAIAFWEVWRDKRGLKVDRDHRS